MLHSAGGDVYFILIHPLATSETTSTSVSTFENGYPALEVLPLQKPWRIFSQFGSALRPAAAATPDSTAVKGD